jgi:anti-repressor protein
MENVLAKFTELNGVAVVSSRIVAEDFKKRHKEVIDKIEEKISGKIHPSNWFVENIYKDAGNRSRKEYLMTRDGFSFIVMGFTGSKADKFKVKYIEAFNEMENELRSKHQFHIPQTYPEALLLAAQQAQLIEEIKPESDRYRVITKLDWLQLNTVSMQVGLIDQGAAPILRELKVYEGYYNNENGRRNLRNRISEEYQWLLDEGYCKKARSGYGYVWQKGLGDEWLINKLQEATA